MVRDRSFLNEIEKNIQRKNSERWGGRDIFLSADITRIVLKSVRYIRTQKKKEWIIEYLSDKIRSRFTHGSWGVELEPKVVKNILEIVNDVGKSVGVEEITYHELSKELKREK